jgi:hypothetical protein
MSRLLAVVAALALSAGCNVNEFALGSDDDAGAGLDDAATGGDGGGTADDAGPTIDAAPEFDSCLPSPELCDEIDNDCDDDIDEDFNLDADPNNCGSCGNACTYDFAFGNCNAGLCEQGDCFPGYIDLNDDPVDGCEYFCIPTAGGIEQCDAVDNDCDGQIDEDFAVMDDVDNCGACGNVCNLLHATAICVAGECEVDTCEPDFYDINPLVPGCELFCDPPDPGVEICDGADNDCDGATDEGNPGGGADCGSDVGACTTGITTCSFGTLFCLGEVTPGLETCNNVDDDCDGSTDEDFSPDTNPLSCGPTCAVCAFTDATPLCAGGVCTMGACNFGFHDINGDPSDGCEYECIDTGAELCDGVDNDCDMAIDEGFDLTTDVDNCGSCGNVCSYPHAGALCAGSTCGMGVCDANFYDIDLDPGTGCEYACIDTGAEVCDLTDNDCDGAVDDGDPGGGVNCGTDDGICTFGTTACIAGELQCLGGTPPDVESCNGIDDDCDSTIDNGFDKLNDPRYCESCAGCALDHAVEGCVAGSCTVVACEAGFIDFNGLPGDGCELECTPTGVEVCDGIDNDCNMVIDDGVTLPPSFCRTAGECAGADVICAGTDGLRCNYLELNAGGANIELDVDNDVLLEETLCDGFDGDCDGGADEPFSLKGTVCAEDGTFGTARKIGACRGTGTLTCNGAQDGLECTSIGGGATPLAETCNNEDDDCDGHIDEPWDYGGLNGVRDDVVGPLTINGSPVVMFQYEAARPDSDGTTGGIVDGRACSSTGRIPWQNVSYDEASAACAAANRRLCEVTRDGGGNVLTDEWGRFCEGAPDRVYPYGNSYASLTCNGADYDPLPGPFNDDVAVTTGFMSSCVSLDGSNDQSGNVKEWVTDARLASGQTVHTLRGGSYNNPAGGLTCDFDFTVATSDFRFPNVGFRCCGFSCAAGLVECSSGSCTNLATDNANCGACGTACGGGESCQNGYCCPSGTEICADQCVAIGTCP